MNRRNFIKGAMSALAGFTILPGAGRVWRAETKIIPAVNPLWVDAPYEFGFVFDPRAYQGEWAWNGLLKGGKFPEGAGDPIRRPINFLPGRGNR